MTDDREMMKDIREAIDACTRGVDEAPTLRYRVLRCWINHGTPGFCRQFPAQKRSVAPDVLSGGFFLSSREELREAELFSCLLPKS